MFVSLNRYERKKRVEIAIQAYHRLRNILQQGRELKTASRESGGGQGSLSMETQKDLPKDLLLPNDYLHVVSTGMSSSVMVSPFECYGITIGLDVPYLCANV